MTDDTHVVSLRVPAAANYIRLARLVGAGLANELGFDLDGLDDVRLAIGEACAIAVQDGAADIQLRYVLGDGRLDVTGEAPLRPGGQETLDDDALKFADQVLDVTCRDHGLARDGSKVSFHLTFGHGH